MKIGQWQLDFIPIEKAMSLVFESEEVTTKINHSRFPDKKRRRWKVVMKMTNLLIKSAKKKGMRSQEVLSLELRRINHNVINCSFVRLY